MQLIKSAHFYILFFFFNIIIVHSQSLLQHANKIENKGLSEEAFLETKSAYRKMMESATYVERRKLEKQKDINDNGLPLPEDFGKFEFRTPEEFKIHYSKWFAQDNRIKKTKYKNIEESVDTM